MRPQWLIADVVPLMATSCGWCDHKDKFKKKNRLRAAVTLQLLCSYYFGSLKGANCGFSETRVHPIRVKNRGLLHANI